MNFLNLIQTDICHPENVSLIAGPMLFCNQCQKSLNIYEYITNLSPDHFRSSQLAQAFYEWTGDENVPMNFTLVDLEGIFPKTIVGQSLSRVVKSLKLLKALNAPFTTRPQIYRFEEMNTFLIDFLNTVHEHRATTTFEASSERKMLDGMIQSMYELLNSPKDSVDLFSTYFNDLVPYVKKCVSKWEPLKVNDSFPNIAIDLLIHLQISSRIRKTFGKFSIPFDMIHVMVSSFACSVDMDVVGNWIMDLMARICRGRFFWKSYPDCPFVVDMTRIIEREILSTKKSNFYKTLRKIQTGESAEHYSTFLVPFHDLQKFIKGKFCRNKHDRIREMAFLQMFPAVCFEDPGDQLGFTVGYNFLIQTINKNNGMVTKGVFKSATSLHKTVQKFIYKINDFEKMPGQSQNTELQWTMDTFRLFLASDPNYEEEIKSVFGMLVHNKQDGN